MHTFSAIIGQERIKQFLVEAIKANRLSHALLFLGPAGIGRTTLALALLSALNCPNFEKLGDADGTCSSCRQISKRNFLYLKFIKPQNSEIKVDQIREIETSLCLNLPQATRQMFIIEPAEKLNPSSSNALLKILEEPPERTYFVLIAENEFKLLSTIRSRCQKIYFEIPRGDVLKSILAHKGRGEKESQILGDISKASIRLGLSKSGPFITEVMPKVLEILDSLSVGAIDPFAAAESLVSLSDDSQGAEPQEIIELIKSVLRDVVIFRTTGKIEDIGNSSGIALIKRIAAKATQDELISCFAAANLAQRAIEGYGNLLLIFEELMIKISDYLKAENKNGF